MSTQLQILTALIEMSVGLADVADGIPLRKLDGKFTHGGWNFAVEWGIKGGTITCHHPPSAQTLRLRAGDLAEFGEFAARCVIPSDFDWPTPQPAWPAKYRYDHAAGEFVIDPPPAVPVASGPRKREKVKPDWCNTHLREYHGSCFLCEKDVT